jgi:ADP-ribosylglycohydrolase
MLSRAELKKQPGLCTDRARGALIGHAIGDSFGDAARTEENHFLFGITMDFREGPAPGTDDTEFALLTAQTLIENSGNLTDEIVLDAWRRHILPLSELHRGGASEREAAANIRRGVLPPLSGQFNSYHLSDGAAMRISPVGIMCAGDPAMAARVAEIEARISHWRDGIWGAQAVAAGVAAAMAGATVDEVFRSALDATPPDSWMHRTMEDAGNIIDARKSIDDAWMPLHRALWTEYKAVAPEAVAEAFAVFLLVKGDFRKGIIYGGNWGRDADTIAAIVGSLCGALHGCSAIPGHWVEKVRIAAGACLPFTRGLDIFKSADALAALIR